MSIRGPPRLDFVPLKLLNSDINADLDPDPAFHSKADPDPNPAYKNNAYPDPQT